MKHVVALIAALAISGCSTEPEARKAVDKQSEGSGAIDKPSEASDVVDKQPEVPEETVDKRSDVLEARIKHLAVAAAVDKQKATLPKRVNSFITWTNTRLVEKEIQNIYLVNEKDLAIPISLAILELQTSGKANILKNFSKNPQTREIFEKGYTFHYSYQDSSGKVLHEFTVDKEDIAAL